MRGKIVDGRYVLGEFLGSGGMGEVYVAHDGVLERDVALKVLRSQYAGDEEFAERFRREARSAASLSHPNIVQVYDRGETEDGTSYIAMEYVPGGTLKEQIGRRGTFGDREAAAVGAQIADALGAAHERDVIHRDIKPQNVLVRASGGLKVTDFGIARAASAATSSASGAILGTAGYLSPEQALGEPVGPASDLYSLGVVLYEMLTGELPLAPATQPLAPAPQAAPRRVDVARRGSTSRVLAVAAVAMAALLGTFLFGLLQDGSGEGSLPRARDFAREILDPPARAAVNTTKTAGASTGNQTGAAPKDPSSASAAPSPTPSAAASAAAAPAAASPERPPVAPVAPPEDRSPAEAQYSGGD